MSSSLVIEASDASGRWYLLPGAQNSYELKLTNESAHAVLCKLNLDEPADAGMLTPSSLTLKAGESRSVSVAFKPEWLTLRDRKVVVSARDVAGTVLATFVHDLVAATTTDCSVSLGWKEEIAGDGALRGFTLLCTIRSVSSTPGIFEPEFTPHPSLRLPEKHRITLGPGESSSFDVPVIWNRSARDGEGWNHPRTIEVGVPVTHGRRTATAPWDLVQQHVEPYLTDADRAPVIARRPPPPQFSHPGGGPPPVSPLPPLAVSDAPNSGGVVTETPAARIARAEMEAGVAAGGMRLPPPSPPPPVPGPPERETIAVAPGTLLIIAFAILAIAIVFVWMLKPLAPPAAVPAGAVPAMSPALPVMKANAHPRAAKPHAGILAAKSSTAPVTSAVVPETHAAAAGTTRPQPAATTAPRAAAAAGSHQRAQAAAPERVSPVDRSALVQLGTVGAEYVRGGRYVHVYWDSYAQARADVQLLNDKSSIIAESTVGRRLGAVLRLPRGYRGSVYVQVTAIGYNGERVVGSASLSPP